MARYRLTPRAEQGLRGIVLYVEAQFGRRVAEAVLDRLVAAFESIAENPGIGHRREDLTSDERTRFWAVPPTLIAYRTGSLGVEIICVERGEMDWERLLRDEAP